MLVTFHCELSNALDHISWNFSHTKAIKWEWGFYCPGSLKEGGHPHLALVERNIPVVEMTCNFEPSCCKRITDLEEKRKRWFEVSNNNLQQLVNVLVFRQLNHSRHAPSKVSIQLDVGHGATINYLILVSSCFT